MRCLRFFSIWLPLAAVAAISLGQLGPSSHAAEPSHDPLDWAYWRGPEQNGISRETGLPDKWDPKGGEGSNLAWLRKDLGGRSTPIVMNGRLYLLVRDKPGTAVEGEKVVCLDVKTGKTLWENRFNVWLSEVPDTRVGWSSVVGDPTTGNVYAQGVCGHFAYIDGTTGNTIWSLPLHERFGLLSTYGGRTNFPVVFEDLVIVSAVIIGWGDMARPAHRLLGLNKLTGEVVWFASTNPLPEDTTYSAPVVTVLGGQKAIVFGSGDGSVWAFQPRTGKPIWEYKFSRRGLNVSPIVDGDKVITGHSEENLVGTKSGALVMLDGSKQGNIGPNGEIWKVEELGIGKCSPLLWDDRLYCFDDGGKLVVLDVESGTQIGKRMSMGTVNRSSPLFADGKIYYTESNGRWWILKPDKENGAKVVSKGNFPSGDECNASPICSHGCIFLLTSGALYCFSDPAKQPGAEPLPPAPQERPASDDNIPAQVQIVPCEVLMQPGETQKLIARLFNARGQFLRESPAAFSLKGPGDISADGTFQAPANANHVATMVTAKVGDLAGTARIRIVPPLPWKFDFEGLTDAPITWVGARYRHVVRKVDGSNVLAKITTIPKGTKSRCWFGQSDLHDYTVQADLQALIQDKKTADMGLIAQGYTLEMQGQHQKLYLSSWMSHDFRTFAELNFSWKPNTWYTMKLRASNRAGKAVVQGKVWPRGEAEPNKWSIELEDAAPNAVGSPGMFGNSTNAEVFIDNLTVTPN